MTRLNIGHYKHVMQCAEAGQTERGAAKSLGVSVHELRRWLDTYTTGEIRFQNAPKPRGEPKIRRVGGFAVPVSRGA
ncbi:hypothetical protein [Thioalkalivibrio sp. ARh3]|uniref:hypothetical protein n=1 Tax=Thioalkalivibrio sp. ARh3 TaxID=1158148 RepID=UPI000378124F|nr:hypothetical protein [Thioalkalivibrio sp. ARh3]